MIPRLSDETIEAFVRRLNRPVYTIEVANRFGFKQHEANTLLHGLASANLLVRSTADSPDHGESFVWTVPSDTTSDA